jgi:uncharacterized protein
VAYPRFVRWKRTDVLGLCLGRVVEHDDDVVLSGRELVVDSDYAVSFTLVVGTEWESESLEADVFDGDETKSLSLIRSEDGGWWVGQDPIPDSAQCDDVDIASTPLTNTPPLVRLGLAVGESAEVPVLWVRVPELVVEVVSQRYERLQPGDGLDRYRFSFVEADAPVHPLTVDDDGLVVDYGGFASRL